MGIPSNVLQIRTIDVVGINITLESTHELK